MGSIKLKTVRDVYNLDCSLCKETFKNPKVLPCLHSFCEVCLEIAILGNERTLTCPTCQEDLEIPTKGVDAFRSNSFVANMLNVLAVQNPTICTNCEDQTMANARCLDCVENLCSDCVEAHERIRQTKDHKIVTFEELQNNAVHDAVRCPSFCYVHNREMLKYYCATCDDAICRDCAIYDHREHSYIDLGTAVQEHRPVIADLLESIDGKTPYIRTALQEVIEVEESLANRRNNVIKVINETISRHMQALEERRNNLLQQVDSLYEEKNMVLKVQQRTLELDLSNLLSSCEFVENILTFGNEAEIMAAKRLMTERLQALKDHKSQTEPEENDVIAFSPGDEEVETGIKTLGHIDTSEIFPSLCEAEGLGLSRGKVKHTSPVKIIAKNRHGEPTGKGGDLVMATLTDPEGKTTAADIRDNGDGTYNVSYTPLVKGNHELSLMIRERHILGSPFEVQVNAGLDLQTIGPLLTTLGRSSPESPAKSSEESYEPWGVAMDKTGLIAITDHYNHRIQIFDSKGIFLHQFGSRGKNDGDIWYPTGIAFDAAGNIFVADHGNHRIQVFTWEGEFLGKFGTRGNGDGQLKGPCDIAIDSDDRVIVADRDNHRVKVFHVDGSYLFQFGGYGNAEGKMNSPRHVAVTSDGDIVVSDTNNYRVQVFDANGHFIAAIGSKGSSEGQFLCPSGVGVDTENHVIIADFKNLNIQVFSLDGKFIKRFGKDNYSGTSVLNKPTAVEVSAAGNILVADRGKGKVLMF